MNMRLTLLGFPAVVFVCLTQTVGQDAPGLQTWTSSKGTNTKAAFHEYNAAEETVTLLIPRTLRMDQLSNSAQKRVLQLVADGTADPTQTLLEENTSLRDTNASLRKSTESLREQNELLLKERTSLYAQIATLQETRVDRKETPNKERAFVELLAVIGTGAKITNEFVVSDKPVHLLYTFSESDAFGSLQLDVYDSNDNLVDTAVNESGSNKGDQTRLRLRPGKYYIKVNSISAWRIKVVESR